MCIKLSRMPRNVCIFIADYDLDINDMQAALNHRLTFGNNPSGIAILTYSSEEIELAREEYAILAKKGN